MQLRAGPEHVGSWLRSALQSLASPRPECGSDPTFGRVSTVASRNADLPRAGVDRLVVDPYATSGAAAFVPLTNGTKEAIPITSS
jgi:hypothetical protein